MSTEPHWITKYREMLDLQRKAEQAEKPFRDLAHEIAREQDDLFDGATILLEEKRFATVVERPGFTRTRNGSRSSRWNCSSNARRPR